MDDDSIGGSPCSIRGRPCSLGFIPFATLDHVALTQLVNQMVGSVESRGAKDWDIFCCEGGSDSDWGLAVSVRGRLLPGPNRCPRCDAARPHWRRAILVDGRMLQCDHPFHDVKEAPPIESPTPSTTSHLYVSTACQHGSHGQCRQRCKFCEARCLCQCHGEVST